LKLTVGLVVAAISLLAFVPLVQAASTTTNSAASGSVTYSIQAVYNGTTKTATVNENVSPSSTAGESIMAVAVSGSASNFTYSRAVNSSLTMLPYLPAITNTSYSYSGKSYSVSMSIKEQGTSQVTFQGGSYTLTNYNFSATVTGPNGTRTVSGGISAFPSDLVYSASATSAGSSVTATLTGTTLPLGASSASPALQASSAGVGISLAIGAVALSLGVKLKSRPKAEGPKPDHWVD
jgi:hypothetical protein